MSGTLCGKEIEVVDWFGIFDIWSGQHEALEST